MCITCEMSLLAVVVKRAGKQCLVQRLDIERKGICHSVSGVLEFHLLYLFVCFSNFLPYDAADTAL